MNLPQRLDPGRRDAAQRLYRLQQQAYRVEADLLGVEEFPPLRESVEDLMRTGETCLVIAEGVHWLGALGFVATAGRVEIHRLVVSPAHFRRGIASGLLAELIRTQLPGTSIIVSTAEANIPALRLYLRLRFAVRDARIVPPDLRLLTLELQT